MGPPPAVRALGVDRGLTQTTTGIGPSGRLEVNPVKYLCLLRFDPTDPAAVAEFGSEAFSRACLEHDEALERAGQLVLAQALEAPAAGSTVREHGGRLSATDGPFAETKEQIAGLVVLEARDRAEAIRLAARSPFARLGSVEVRPFAGLSVAWPASAGGRRGLRG
jgi:hypothetical protein